MPWRTIGEFLGMGVGLAFAVWTFVLDPQTFVRMGGWRNPFFLPILIIASGIGIGVGGIAGFGLGCLIEMIRKARKKSQPTVCSKTRPTAP
jgi:cell division protein FtsW (lipid II flippase)